MFQAVGGVINAYRMLLGDNVIKTMLDRIGKDNAKKFLKLHSQYDGLVKKNPKADPMQAMRAQDIPVFKDFESYEMFLKKLESQLKVMREPISKAMHQIIAEMIKLAETKSVKEQNLENPKEPLKVQSSVAIAKSKSKKPIFGKSVFHTHDLPTIPVNVRNQQDLPYSYPSWDGTLDIVVKYAEEKNYKARIESELTDTLKSGLIKVLDSLPADDRKTIKELVAEAQEYLMDHNWLQYGLENVAQASYNIASAGIKHEISTNGVIKHLATTRTLAYAFLGAQLEIVLRRGCYAITKDISANMVFAGRNASFDVLSSACSFYVQELGRHWLDTVQSKLK